MIKFEDPVNFNTTLDTGSIKIVYSNLMEVCQGGPILGDISINNTIISNYRFGGPFLYENNLLFAPVYIKGFLNSGFKIGKVNAEDCTVVTLGKKMDLIILDRIEDNRIYFFVNIDKTTIQYHEL